MIPGLNAVMENAICQELHPELNWTTAIGHGEICKGSDVQGELAVLRGWQTTFDCIPGRLVILERTAKRYRLIS